MTKHYRSILICGLSLLLVVLFALDLCVGSVFIPLSRLFDSADTSAAHQIMLDLRLPKAITAIMAGVGLSLTGLIMQTLFRNPLAGPYLLGVSSGATLGVAFVTMAASLLALPLAGGGTGIVLAAIVGSTLVLLLVMAIAHRVESNVSLLIVGMMIGSVASALVNVVQNFSNPDALKLFIVWTLGSLSSVTWTQMPLLVGFTCLGVMLCITLVKPLNGLLLGENYAHGLGINLRRVRLMIVVATGLLAGCITAFCGPIAFVGVAVPHIARGVMKTSEHGLTMLTSALVGADLLLVCDMLSSMFTYPLPISTVSALFGAPIIIWIIVRKK
ncbi:MAG: iron ABC transporter permease [Paludibacteraceae bacterium]|nr:iron ABC transporter permease [Paludibacteraceae bacterium]